MKIHELRYSTTNTYLIEGDEGNLLFDTGWAGTFPAFCKALGEIGVSVRDIRFLLISHYHPDHMGIAQEIADQGVILLVPQEQKAFLHAADGIFAKEKRADFVPIKEDEARYFSLEDGRKILREIGIEGEIFHTPGHSEDSISLWLDEGALLVGDLNPLYELELHKGTQIGKSWETLLKLDPEVVYYGHAKKTVLKEAEVGAGRKLDEEAGGAADSGKYYELVSQIMKMIDKGYHLQKIQKKTGADATFIENVMRMYLTHQNIGVQGILDRIEIINR